MVEADARQPKRLSRILAILLMAVGAFFIPFAVAENFLPQAERTGAQRLAHNLLAVAVALVVSGGLTAACILASRDRT